MLCHILFVSKAMGRWNNWTKSLMFSIVCNAIGLKYKLPLDSSSWNFNFIMVIKGFNFFAICYGKKNDMSPRHCRCWPNVIFCTKLENTYIWWWKFNKECKECDGIHMNGRLGTRCCTSQHHLTLMWSTT
jgi:hypothetical protein